MERRESNAMSLSGFFHSYPGLYVTQAFFHSLVASIVAELAIKAWDVRDPAVRQKVFLVPVVAPVFLLPLFQLFRPERGSSYFRLGTIFESGRWLELEMLGTYPVMGGLVLVFAVTSLVFLFQELIRSWAFVRGREAEITVRSIAWRIRRSARRWKPCQSSPPYSSWKSDDFMIYSTTGKSAAVCVLLARPWPSRRNCDPRSPQISTSSRPAPVLVAAYSAPGTHVLQPRRPDGVRRAARRREVCDEFAVSVTRNRRGLVQALRKLVPAAGRAAAHGRKTRKTAKEIEERSHRMNIEPDLGLESGEP
jgi:hypothetical protein